MTEINSLTLTPSTLGYDYVTFLFDLRKTPSPVLLVPKEPEKSTERLGKGTKSHKDLRRYIPYSVKVTVKHAATFNTLQCFLLRLYVGCPIAWPITKQVSLGGGDVHITFHTRFSYWLYFKNLENQPSFENQSKL